MKRLSLLLILTIALTTVAFAQKKSAGAKPVKAATTGGQAQFKKLEEDWVKAMIERDVKALNLILADDYFIIDPDGKTTDKAGTLEDIKSGAFKFESIEFSEFKVRVYGTTAVVNGGEVVKGSYNGQSITGAYRFTDVFARRNGRWLAVSSQLTASNEVGLVKVKKSDGTTEITTPSGLKYIDLVEGNGASPRLGQTVTVHYTGTLEDGKKFDSSVDRGQPFNTPIGVGRVIKGWDEGVMSMKVGGKRRLIIPAYLGYGARGAGNGVIPPNATLIFEIELLGVK
ncbi:MAG: FKBP-type peptidyl-prolyl cis-trans isomerase [Acidobacteriota bacterium]